MSDLGFAKLMLATLIAGLLLGSALPADARECRWLGTPPICEPQCPKGWQYMSKRSGGCLTGSLILCCEPQGSTTYEDGVAPCHKQCGPLLGSVKPKSEAQRVYRNCRAMCDKKGTITCPDGSTRPWNKPKC